MTLHPGLVEPMIGELETLVDLLREAGFVLGRNEDREAERQRIVEAATRYLLPRLASIDAPVVVAIVGATGTGKSTLLNALVGRRVSSPGPLRPTTKVPIAWVHSRTAAAMRPELDGVVETQTGEGSMTAHVILIDTPPIDTTATAGAAAAREILELADICIFVTSPSRYADALGWEFVARAQSRGVPTLFVLNRLPAEREESESLLADLATRLHDGGLLLEPDAAMLFPVLEATPGNDREIDASLVGALRAELTELGDDHFRNALMTQTVLTTCVSVAQRAQALVEGLEAEDAATAHLHLLAESAYEREAHLLRDELLAGSFADIARRETWPQAAADLGAIVTRRAGIAAQGAASRWSEEELGRLLLDHGGDLLWRHGEQVVSGTGAALESFASDLLAAVRDTPSRRWMLPSRTDESAAEVWRLALDPDRLPPAWLVRRYGDHIEALVTETRDQLGAAASDQVLTDRRRFEDLLQERMVPGLAERLAAVAQSVVSLARSAVPHPPGPESRSDELDA